MKKAKSRFQELASAWLPVALYMAVIFYFSSMPLPPTAEAGVLSNKILHVVEYAGLGLLVARAAKKHGLENPSLRLVVLAFVFAFAYGASDEIHQFFVPGRHMAFTDALLDSFGGLIGGTINVVASRLGGRRLRAWL
ncbi:MAG: VanZ family protein [Candidatus Micrarchaeota archaeon]|nr:VanZ family protein [Candidatus Micrarchaeota archaeon]